MQGSHIPRRRGASIANGRLFVDVLESIMWHCKQQCYSIRHYASEEFDGAWHGRFRLSLHYILHKDDSIFFIKKSFNWTRFVSPIAIQACAIIQPIARLEPLTTDRMLYASAP